MGDSHSDSDCPHFDVHVRQEELQDEFGKILQAVKPTWKKENIVYEQSAKDYNKGLINAMIRCYNQVDPSDAIMIRLTNNLVDFLVDRELEIASIKRFMKLGCAPKMLATFKGGFCYLFVHGEILTSNRLSEEPIWRRIADAIAKCHAEKVEDVDKLIESTQVDHLVDQSWKMFPTELKNPEKNEIFKRDVPNKLKLMEEWNWVSDHCKMMESPIMLCHNDTRAENIIWNYKTNSITFVDFECAGYNYQAFEIAAHFARYCGFYPADYTLYPTKEVQLQWLRYYLAKYNQYTKNGIIVTDTDVSGLYVQVSKCYLLYLLSWGIMFAGLDHMNIIDEAIFNFFDYSVKNFKEYFKEKERIAEMKMPK